MNANEMEDYRENETEVMRINHGLDAMNGVIYELDDAIQDTGNLELSRTLNEIYDSYQSIRQLLTSLEN